MRFNADARGCSFLTTMLCHTFWRRAAALLCLAALVVPPEVSAEEDSLVVMSGNVTFAVMAQVNGVRDGHCGDYNVYSLQEMVALTWFMDAVNDMDYVPGITIGLEAYRTCRLPSKAAKGTVDLLHKGRIYPDHQSQPLLFGILGPDTTAEATVVSSLIGYLPANQHLLQISGSATGKELADKTLHPNFFRVVTSDHVQVKVMQKVLEKLDWNYVAIVYDDDDYGKSAATKLKKLLEEKGICVPLFVSLPLDTGSSQFEAVANSIALKLHSAENGTIRGLVMVASGPTTQQLLRILDSQVRFPQLILSEAVGLNTAILQTPSGHILPLAAGALLTAPPYIPVPEFEELWTDLWMNMTRFSAYAQRLPWLADYFLQLTGCSLSADCWAEKSEVRAGQAMTGEAQKILFVGYAVKAAAVMVELLKRVQREKCGAGYLGVCENLSSSIEARVDIQSTLQSATLNLAGMASVLDALGSETSVAFDSDGNVILGKKDVEYTVYNLVKGTDDQFSFKQVGTYRKFTLPIEVEQTEFYNETNDPMTWDELPRAQCDDNQDCLHCGHDVSGDVMFVEGDFYVIALVAVNDRSLESPLGCGEVKGSAGGDVAQAVLMAVEEINKKDGTFKNILPGRTVGLVAINTCSSPLYVRQKLTDFYAGTLTLPDERKSSDVVGKVVGVVDADDSDSSMAIYDTLSRLLTPFVQVSGTATATELKDRREYPFFTRLLPAHDTQALVILDIVQSLGVHSIQVIYDSSTAYAKGILERLQEETSNSRYNICLAQTVAVTPHPHTSQYQYIASKLREKSTAQIVLILLDDAEIDKVMTAILPLLTSTDHFRFLGSDRWGRREELIRHRPALEGSLVLATGVDPNPAFQRYFTSLALSPTSNPWLSVFWEARLTCFMDKSFVRRGRRPCPENPAQDEHADDYEQEAAVPLSILATYALVKGFHAAVTDHCGANATGVCEDLTSASLASAVRDVELDIQGGQGRESAVFDSNGDGALGYTVLQVVPSAGGEGVVYVEVGTWTSSGLSLKRDELIPLDKGSVCPPGSVDCDQCDHEVTPASSTPPSTRPEEAEGLSVPVVAGVGTVLIVIVIVLVIVIVVLICRRRRRGPKEKDPGYDISRHGPGGCRGFDSLRDSDPSHDYHELQSVPSSVRYTPPPGVIPVVPARPGDKSSVDVLAPATSPPPPQPCLPAWKLSGDYLKPTPPSTPPFRPRLPSDGPTVEPDYIDIIED